MKLFVIPGHGAGDPGACGNGYSEAERVRALATRIKKLGGDAIILADFNRNYYADNGISNLALDKSVQIVELHMDSGPESARGGHVIIQGGIGGPDKYDKALAKSIAQIFPGRAVTLDERTDLANPGRAASRGYGYRLVENGFISNAQDVKVFNSKIDELAKAYLNAFGIKEANVPTPAKTAADYGYKDGLYKVVKDAKIRTLRKGASDLCCIAAKGTALKIKDLRLNSVGNIWGQIAEGDHKGRYVCCRTKAGTKYLTKV